MSMNIVHRPEVDTMQPCAGGGEGYFLGVAVRPFILGPLPDPAGLGSDRPRRSYADHMGNDSAANFINNLRLTIADPTVKGLDVIFGHIATDHDDVQAGEKLRALHGAALHELVNRYVFVDELGAQAEPASEAGYQMAIDLNTGYAVQVAPEQAVITPRGNPGYAVKVDAMTQIVHPSQLDGTIDLELG